MSKKLAAADRAATALAKRVESLDWPGITAELDARGAATTRQGAASRPASCISSTDEPTGAEVRFIAAASCLVTKFATNSPVSSALRMLSL